MTVNSEHEALHPLIDELNVEVVRIRNDASALTGRPHVFLQDLIEAGLQTGAEQIFITNADIELQVSSEAQAKLNTLGPDQVFVAHRHDHDGNKTGSTLPYFGGVDFFGAHRDLFTSLNCGTLVFGMPWWDHFVPLIMLGRDRHFFNHDGLHAWHLKHGGRWRKDQHIDFGYEFLRLLRTSREIDGQHSRLGQYLAEVDLADQGRYGDTIVDQIKNRAIALFPSTKVHKKRFLRQVSRLNEALFAEIMGR